MAIGFLSRADSSNDFYKKLLERGECHISHPIQYLILKCPKPIY